MTFQHEEHERGLNDIAATDALKKMMDGRKTQDRDGLVKQEHWKDTKTKGKGGGGEVGVRERKHNGLKSDVDSKDKEQQQEHLVPPDGGWGWMVAVGSFLVTTLLPCLGPCFGVLFSTYLLSENTSSTVTAWIFNVQAFIWNTAGIFSRPLSRELGWRRVGVTGAALAALGLGCSAFTPSPLYLFLTFSVMTGVGGGIVTALCFTILPLYFDRKRGIANAIMMGGICFGQIIGPPAARLLQEEYGYKGATLILGAILLHSCIGASFFHPPEWYLKPSVQVEEDEEDKGEKLLISKDLTRVLMEEDSGLPRTESAPGDLESNIPGIMARKRMTSYPGMRRLSRTSLVSTANSALSISSLDVAGRGAPLQEPDTEEENSEDGNDNSTCSMFSRVMKSTISDLSILKSSRACIICLGAMLLINSYLNFIMMVPFALISAGHSLDLSAWCISASAVCNFIFRILVSLLSDARWFNLRLCYVTGFLIVGAVTFVFPFVDSPQWLIVTLALFGSGVGSAMGLHNLVMIDVMGIDLLAPVFGSTCLCVGIGFICLGPLIGFIRDKSGSYSVSIWFTSAMLLVGLLLWLLMPLATRLDHKKITKKRLTVEEGEKQPS